MVGGVGEASCALATEAIIEAGEGDAAVAKSAKSVQKNMVSEQVIPFEILHTRVFRWLRRSGRTAEEFLKNRSHDEEERSQVNDSKRLLCVYWYRLSFKEQNEEFMRDCVGMGAKLF